MRTRRRQPASNYNTCEDGEQKKNSKKGSALSGLSDKQNQNPLKSVPSSKDSSSLLKLHKFPFDHIDQYFVQILNFCQNYSAIQNSQTDALKKCEMENHRVTQIVSNNNCITNQQRMKLVGWIMAIHSALKLRPDTLYMTILLVDQFAQKTNLKKKNYQLAGLACLFIAGKYEQICTLKLRSLNRYFEDLYCTEDLLNMESKIFQTLQFKISHPTVNWFLMAYTRQLQHQTGKQLPLKFNTACCYLMDLCILQKQVMDQFQAKYIAKAILYVVSMIGQFLHIDSRILIQQISQQDRKILKQSIGKVRKIFQKKLDQKYRIVNSKYQHLEIIRI